MIHVQGFQEIFLSAYFFFGRRLRILQRTWKSICRRSETINQKPETIKRPQILAPAGNKASFLAAVAAGADAVYCGLKAYSARMEAKNFTVQELAPLTQLAHEKGIDVFVAINSLLKQEDLSPAGNIIAQLSRHVKPDAIIVQDLALVDLVKQANYTGELHLSTLANVSFPSALKLVREKLGVSRVVIPRELSVDEIKTLAGACPEGLSLEVFVHGALCYGISGRCYWSSYLGGKSGLRGRCVQPCRRLYTQEGRIDRLFSCVDLNLDVLSRVLLTVPNVSAWKIEGRKKGPHYVYYTVTAYKILRDLGNDPKEKKTAVELLARALGRKGTHYNFLPQRPWNPVASDSETGSGLLIGKIQGPKQNPYFMPREDLMSGDLLRIGYEDESSHGTIRVGKYVPKKGRLYIKLSSGKTPAAGVPVFLTDRREKALDEMISELESEIVKPSLNEASESSFIPDFSKKADPAYVANEVYVYRAGGKSYQGKAAGLWLDDPDGMPKKYDSRLWWWLPPVIWPPGENGIKSFISSAIGKGCRNFVLNAPWQIALFDTLENLNIWAGPFCNISNVLAVRVLKSLGFSGIIVSPEMGRDDYLTIIKHSPLPLGMIISGNWPFTISRVLSERVKPECAFISPKGEQAWVKRYGSNFWVYPNWKIDLMDKKGELQKAGYSMFVHLVELLPDSIDMKTRKGIWNWDMTLI